LLSVYKFRARNVDELRLNHVIGFETLLPELENSAHSYICISEFCTPVGTFIVFSDFSRTDLIGVLFSKTTLKEVKDKKDEHIRMIENFGQSAEHGYTLDENIFLNGQLQLK
jgi:hypothetical protein